MRSIRRPLVWGWLLCALILTVTGAAHFLGAFESASSTGAYDASQFGGGPYGQQAFSQPTTTTVPTSLVTTTTVVPSPSTPIPDAGFTPLPASPSQQSPAAGAVATGPTPPTPPKHSDVSPHRSIANATLNAVTNAAAIVPNAIGQLPAPIRTYALPILPFALVGAFLILHKRHGDRDKRILGAPIDDELTMFEDIDE